MPTPVDTLILNPGTYYQHEISISKNIIIRANASRAGTAANTIIDAQTSPSGYLTSVSDPTP